MRSGSILPEFSSTIFFCRAKNGTSVGQAFKPLRVVAAGIQAANDLGAVSARHRGEHLAFRLHAHQRTGAAQPHAADALDEHLVLHTRFGYFLFQGVAHLLGAARKTAGRDAHADVVLELLLRLAFRLARSCEVPQWSFLNPRVAVFLDPRQYVVGSDLAEHGLNPLRPRAPVRTIPGSAPSTRSIRHPAWSRRV